MNTSKVKAIGLIILTGLFTFGGVAQQVRNVVDFTGIKAGNSFEILLSPKNENSVQVNAPENLQPQIKTEVKNGILVISEEGNLKTDKDIVISIGVKSINSISISGAANLKTENQINCDKIFIESNGAGDVYMNLKANEIHTENSGAGDITLEGQTQKLESAISGAGALKATDLEADKANIKVSGAGDAKVYVKQILDADVSGAGSIIYKGNPLERNVNISGAGSVRESKSGTGEETASDTTKFKLGKNKIMIFGDDDEQVNARSKKDSLKSYNEKFKHWSGYDLGINGFLDYKNSLDVPPGASFLELDYGKSIQFGLNIVEKDFHIHKNYLNVVTGFGFDFNHYAFQNNVTLNGDTSYLWAWNDSIKYKKNKLNVSYIKVPLLLECNTSKNPNKNFHIAAGIEFAYRIHAVTKQKYELNDVHHSSKQRDDFNLEPFRYSAVARIGYNDVTIFANYGLNRLFKKNKGPQAYPFTIGVTVAI